MNVVVIALPFVELLYPFIWFHRISITPTHMTSLYDYHIYSYDYCIIITPRQCDFIARQWFQHQTELYSFDIVIISYKDCLKVINDF